MIKIDNFQYFSIKSYVVDVYYAPVICIHGPLGARDTGDIAGLKCRNLTSDVSRQCRGCAGFKFPAEIAYKV